MEFRLVVEAEDSWEGPTEVIDGRVWKVSEPINIKGSANLPRFHIISYSWGKTKDLNMFSQPGEISARTRGALEAAIKSTTRSDTQRYWIDAVCVPRANPERLHTLESMGFVYACAESCIVILENATWNVLSHNVASADPLSSEDMQTLNKEPWTLSVWTYQEIMNPGVVVFTTYNLQTPVELAGDDFLNIAGFSLLRWKEQSGKSSLDSMLEFPGLCALEDALLDWYQSRHYLDRPALSCLTALAARVCDPARPANRLYALYGLLTQEPTWSDSEQESVVALTEKAMIMCEDRNDFSFIYTSNPRESAPNRLWRPQPDPELGLVPMVRWNCIGAWQSSDVRPEGLELHAMAHLKLGEAPSDTAVTKLKTWQHGFNGAITQTLLEVQIELLAALEKLGLQVGAHCLPCNYGLIFGNVNLQPAESMEAYASTEVMWAFGHPGIAKIFEGTVLRRCVPFVYAGQLLEFVEPKVSVELF